MSSTEEMIVEIKEKRNDIMKYAKAMTNMPIDNLAKSHRSRMIQKYSVETISTYLANPSKYESQLRDVVDYLCSTSPQFARLVEYIPNMALITPYIKQKLSITSSKKKNKSFNDMCEYADSLDMKNQGNKIIKEVFKYGVFFGIEVEGTYSTYIKRLDPSLCKIIGEGEMGLSFAFNFSYFNNNEFILDNGYPPEFRSLFNTYKSGTKTLEGLKLGAEWQPLPDEITICIKYDLTNLDYSVPPYVSNFSAIYDLQEYQSLNKAKVTAENYTLIGLKIPTLGKEEVDDYAISNDMIDATTAQLDSSLPDYMGYFTTATDIVTVKASTSSDGKVDNVANAVKNVWNASGMAETLFGVDTSNSGTLKYSIKVDEQQLFPIYRQLEKHWDYRIKEKFKNNFKLKLIDTTWFNLGEMIDWYMKQAQFSVPVAVILPLLLGFDMSDIQDLSLMQEEIFEIFETWKALSSSYTSSGSESSDEGGRPLKKEEELTESGEKTRKNESNSKR